MQEKASFLSGGGEIGALMRSHDWSTSPLGPPESWPQSLRAVVALMINSRYPMFVAWGAELAFLYNDGYAPIFGAKHPHMLGRPFKEAWTEIWDDIWPLIERALSGEATYNEDLHLVMERNGYPEDTWYSFSYSPVREESGEIAGMFCACTETTQNVLATNALRESEKRFEQIANSAPVPMWVTRPDRTRSFVNRAYLDFVGLDYELARALDWRTILHPDDHDRIVAESIHGEASQQTFVLEARYRGGDGDWRWIRSTSQPRLGADGVNVGFIGIAHDVTEAKRAEISLRASEQRFREQFENANDYIFTTDLEMRLTSCNPAVAEALERTHDELIGTRISDYTPPETWEWNKKMLADKLSGKGDTTRYEVEVFDRRGERMTWDVNSRLVRDAAGEPRGLHAIARDVSARNRDAAEKAAMVAQLAELNETLESRVAQRTAELEQAQQALRQSQKLEAMGQLTGGVAHDFNNLLTPIMGSLDLLHRRSLGDEREQALVEGALQSAERAKLLVQRLLAFARRQPLKTTAVDMGALITGMADLIGSTCGPNIKVSVAVDDDIAPAMADANQLEMAILNLSVNARDAMPDGGRLTLSATSENVESGDKDLPAGRYVRMSVADTGSGMEEMTLRRAVEPFFSTKGIGQGTGLGLSMAHGLASQLGGRLTISSKPGLGTNVELWLPASDARVEAGSTRNTAIKSGATAGTVLLVDDEQLVRASTAGMLSDLGYEVVEAASAEEALGLSDAGDFDFVLTDHLMPGMNGVDLAHALREGHPDIPVLIVSGYAEIESIPAYLPRLAKPFRQADLAAAFMEIDETFAE